MNESSKLTEEQICECLKSLNVPVRLNDLKVPSKELMIRIFDAFLRDLHINIAHPLQQPFNAIKDMENPEICEEGQMLIILASTVNQILKNISPLTVTVNDIVAPKPKRTKKILNYMIIFWNTYMRKYSLFESVEVNLEEKMQNARDLKEENDLLDEKYQECLEKLENMKPAKDELLEIVSIQTEKMRRHEKHREIVMEEHQHLKEKENNLKTQISNLDVDIITMKERLNELDELIISSPEKIDADIQKIKRQVKEEDLKIQEKELEKKHKKKNYQSLMSDLEHVENSIVKQNEIHKELLSLSETVENLSQLSTKCKEEKKSLEELLLIQERKEALAYNYDQKATKIQLMKKKRSEEMTEMYNELKRQVSDAKLSAGKIDQSISQVEDKINKTADSILKTVEESKEAKVITDKVKAQHALEVKSMAENFGTDCKEIVEETKRVLGFK